MQQYVDKALPLVRRELPKQVFILLTAALDDFLERHGFSGTLGQRYVAVRSAINIPGPLNASVEEVILRRNDVAHSGGRVGPNYVSGTKQFTMISSSNWIKTQGTPSLGGDHSFDLKYLYEAASTIHAVGGIVANATAGSKPTR